jgi:hypothetical protein
MSDLKPMENRFTQDDINTSNMLHAALMDEKISGRDIYNLVKENKLSKGAELLVSDYIDFGRYAANDKLDAYKQKIMKGMTEKQALSEWKNG